MSKPMKVLEQHHACGGEVRFLSHPSRELGLEAKVGLFLPCEALRGHPVPVVYALAGLTCTEETFLTKANAVRFAAEYGLALVTPDTSPRGAGIPHEDDAYDLGTGAGYYVDATAAPWSRHYRMASYIGKELPMLMEAQFPLDPQRCGVMGHSMGGMGALGFALQAPEKWKSVSAFAPIAAPSQVEWGQKATESYFGGREQEWATYDPTLLLRAGKRHPTTILVDQGMKDQFLERYLRPECLEQAAQVAGQKLIVHRREDYDHSYWFVQSVIADHIRHHVEILRAD